LLVVAVADQAVQVRFVVALQIALMEQMVVIPMVLVAVEELKLPAVMAEHLGQEHLPAVRQEF
jgi:hypothetical protein